MIDKIERQQKPVPGGKLASDALESSPGRYGPSPAAPLTRAARRALQAAHTALLLGLIVLAGWFLWSYVLRGWQPGSETVRTVGQRMVVVFAPADGVFRRESTLHHGTRVSRGELVGKIESASVSEESAALEAEIQALTLALLRHDSRLVPPQFLEGATQGAQYHVELAIRLQRARQRLAQVQEKAERLRIHASIDGTVYFDVADSQAVVHDHTPILQIWPDGAGVLVQIDAPLARIMDLVDRGTARCRFDTPEDVEIVEVRLLPSTLQTYFDEDPVRQRRHPWGSVKGTPLDMPEDLREPGIVGSLE
jgi:hypothetical protein